MANDYLHTDEMDLLINNGDFATGNTDEQQIQVLLLAQKGEVKAFPLAGVGIRRYGLAPWSYGVMKKLEKNIRVQLQYDGVRNPDVQVNNDKIHIDAKY